MDCLSTPALTPHCCCHHYGNQFLGGYMTWAICIVTMILQNRPRSHVPFQCEVNSSRHHLMSDLADTFNLRNASNRSTFEARSISHLRKVLPCRTALDACCKKPISNSSSLFRPALHPSQSLRRALSLISLSCGKRISCTCVSNSMPRNVRHDA